MSDFDARLLARLERLDAAVPEPAVPMASVKGARRRNRRRQGFVLVAAAVSLLAATALAVIANPPLPDPAVEARNAADERRVLDDLALHTATACFSKDDAVALFRERLDALGLAHWTIRADDRIREARCVGAAVIGDSQELLLMPSLGGEVAAALDLLSAKLLLRCATRDEAVSLLRGVLTRGGWADPKIEVIGNVPIVPIDADAYIAHFEAGCAVYSNTQFDQVGRYTWYLSAK